MQNSGWSLREEIGYWVSRWYWVVLVFLVGSGIGWGSAYMFPTRYEAVAPLSVAFNSDQIFTSPDDYKNAQFEHVDDLILSDVFLDAVLEELSGDDRWASWTRDSLRASLSLRWRNAGRWDLVAKVRNPEQAVQLANLWRGIAYQHLTDALSHAQALYQLDQDLGAIAHAQEAIFQKQARLRDVEMGVQDWLSDIGGQTLDEETRKILWAYAQFAPPPNGFPDTEADQQAFIQWAENFLALLEAEQSLLAHQALEAEARRSVLAEDWLANKQASQGLSAFLLIEQRYDHVEAHPAREPGMLALVGGGVGVLAWLGFRLIWVARFGQRDD